MTADGVADDRGYPRKSVPWICGNPRPPVTGSELLAQIRRAVAAYQLWPSRARVMIAVSGGADSVALLHALTILRPEWKLTLRVAHLDHGLRDGSAEDAAFVQQLCAAWRIPATIERHQVQRSCAEYGWSLEDGARRVRYQFLLETAKRYSASRIALAHTADDQAETVLMRLVRGTGLTGLGAIPVKRPLADDIWVVRPMLAVWRREITAYLRKEGLAHREDASNRDQRFVRNRIRHELLPLLERQYNTNIKGTLAQLAEQSRSDYSYLQEAAERQWKRTAKVTRAEPRYGREVAMSIPLFLRQPKALQRQLVRRAIQNLRGDVGQFEFRHWLEVERLFVSRPDGTLVDLPGGVRLARHKDRVICRLTSPVPAPFVLD